MALDYLPNPSWAVVYGETPSADQWSELGENDDALATGVGIDDLAIINRHLATAAASSDKLAAAIIQGTNGSSVNPVPTTIADVGSSSVTFSVPVASYMLVTWGARIQTNVSMITDLYLNVNGTDLSESVQMRQANGSAQNHLSLARTQKIALPLGSNTIKLRVVANTSNASVLNMPYWYGVIISQA